MAAPCACCGTPCCPSRVLPAKLCATVTSGCGPLNASVTLTIVRLEDGSICWSGEAAVAGCTGCTRLIVSVCCSLVPGVGYAWGIAWHVERVDNVLCVITQLEGSTTTQSVDCGPPFVGHLVSTHLNLFGSDGSLCCGDFTITIDIAECP